VRTVTGPVRPDKLGLTLAHEHLLLDGSCFFVLDDAEDAETFADKPVTFDLVPRICQASCSNRDNLVLDDQALAAIEIARFKKLGGSAIVDVTSGYGLGRDPLGLRKLSQETGVSIVMGCGFYCEYSHPELVAAATVDELAELMIRDIVVGIEGVPAGIIGEIGINGQEKHTWRYLGEMTPDEEKVLRAAARTSLATGASVSIHQPNRSSAVFEIVRVLEEEHLSPDRVILGHMSSVWEFTTHLWAVDRGYWIAYDNFGMERLSNPWHRPLTDVQRMQWLAELFRLGFGSQVLISQDVWCKVQLSHFGGFGYSHILQSIIPKLRGAGLTSDDIDRLLITNPAKALAF
jgi:phosphotriesterase-related protein